MSNEQPHDPTVTLRLELGRVTDQRNAFQAALHKDVLKIIYDATLAADAGFADTVGDLEKELDELKAENARLKAEVERINEAIIAGLAIIQDAKEVP
jgi:cell division protein FtsB